MNRRETLKTLMAATGSLIALPSWAAHWTRTDVAGYATSFTTDEQVVLSAVADAIIPPGNSIGALSVGVDKFLVKLIDNCYEKDVQDNVKIQLRKLDDRAQQSFQKSYSACDLQQRQESLLKLATSDDKAENDFFKLIKSETIRGFSTSREVMVDHQKYRIAPGHYYGCVDLKA